MKKIFFVAEIGINHNGSVEVCKELINVAHKSGADAIKLQKRDIESVYSAEFLDSPRESPWGVTQRDQKNGLEFGIDEYKEVDAYCQSLGIEWFASAWDLKSQTFLQGFDTRYNKVASAMIVHIELLREIAQEKKHTFISTGMSSYKQIDRAVEIFREYKCPFELMHTVSTYPMRDADANLRVINTLRERYLCDVGYSGHESGLAVSYAAAAMGITSLERHITLDRAMYGSDQSASLEPSGLQQLISGIRKIEEALGDGIKRTIDEERKIEQKLREHISDKYKDL